MRRQYARAFHDSQRHVVHQRWRCLGVRLDEHGQRLVIFAGRNESNGDRASSANAGQPIEGPEDIYFMVAVLTDKWRDVAVTFGQAHGPFALDETMPRICSMRSTRYEAQAIFAENVEGLQDAYDLPVVHMPVMTVSSFRALGALKKLTLAGNPSN